MAWFKPVNINAIHEFQKKSMPDFLEIRIIEIGDDFIKAKMPVNEKTKQAHGILHGGANAVLAESLGSLGSLLTLNLEKKTCVGLEINTNHIRSAHDGFVYGTAKPIHLGQTTHLWEIRIYDEQNRLISISRLTNIVLDKKAEKGV